MSEERPDIGGWAAAAALDARSGFRTIDSVAELRDVLGKSDQRVRMKPGVYAVKTALEDDQTVFWASGSRNHFDLRGVTIQIDTRALAGLRSTKAHELATYRIYGSNLPFEGAVFEDIGEHPPQRSLPEFEVQGDHVTFRDCTFIVRGSRPYGYGDLFGKGAKHSEPLFKHSIMRIAGENTSILECSFYSYAFGHAIALQGAVNTLIRDCTVEGTLRPSDDILAEKSGPAAKHGFVRLASGKELQAGEMVCLCEDGIRAYTKDFRTERKTRGVAVINCTVHRMRGGITLAMAEPPVRVVDCRVTQCGFPGHSYIIGTRAIVENCRGDARYVPLLGMPYVRSHGARIELELIDGEQPSSAGALAHINGRDHRILIGGGGKCGVGATALPIMFSAHSRTDLTGLSAERVRLENDTFAPVVLEENTRDCKICTFGEVLEDRGQNNTICRPEKQGMKP